MIWDTESVKFTLTEGKVEKMRSLARKVMKEVRAVKRWVSR